MSITLTKSSVKPTGPLAGAPSLPQVNLLPPEIRAARGLVHTKRWLGISLAAVILVVGLVYAFALYSRGVAERELVAEQLETSRLQEETAQYAEVPRVLNNIERATAARTLGTSTEVLWKPYIDAITAVLPPNTSIDTFAVAQAAPWLEVAGSQDPLVPTGVATITFSARAVTLPDSAAWLDALDSIPNFAHPTISSASVTALDGPPYYAISSTVQVETSAVALRFAAEGN